MSPVFKYLRLLPAVVIVGAGLLAIKGVDLARAAVSRRPQMARPHQTSQTIRLCRRALPRWT
jgi:hypothetical protein